MPPLELNFVYHINFKGKVSFYEGTQNLPSFYNLLSTLLTVGKTTHWLGFGNSAILLGSR